jgi:hypothetical protein
MINLARFPKHLILQSFRNFSVETIEFPYQFMNTSELILPKEDELIKSGCEPFNLTANETSRDLSFRDYRKVYIDLLKSIA